MKKVQLWDRSLLELPSELMSDILCRLAIKTWLRCKLVCKDWYSILSSPRFADLRRSYCSPCATLMLKSRFPNRRYHFVLLELDKESNNSDQEGNIRVGTDSMIKLKSKFGVPNSSLLIGNVCNGLVCLKSSKAWGCYYICSFLVSRFVTIEQSKLCFHSLYKFVLGCCPMNNNAQQHGSCLRKVWGDPVMGNLILDSKEANSNGYCPMTQYKLLRILETRSCEYVAEILTLGCNQWRQIHDAPKSCYDFQAFLNGSYHWYDNWNGEFNIWAFDFGTEKFLPIRTLHEFKVISYAALTVFDSCLCFCCVYDSSSTVCEVWLMKEYGVGDSWVRQLFIHAPVPLWYKPLMPLVQLDNGHILINNLYSCLALYDPETRSYKKVKIDGVFDINNLEVCDTNFC